MKIYKKKEVVYIVIGEDEMMPRAIACKVIGPDDYHKEFNKDPFIVISGYDVFKKKRILESWGKYRVYKKEEDAIKEVIKLTKKVIEEHQQTIRLGEASLKILAKVKKERE